MPRILRSEPAKRDAAQIWEYIARDNSDAADRLLDRFDQALELIVNVPMMGRPRDALFPGLRSFRVGNYLLFYRTIAEGIELIRVLHGARDLPQHFKPEP